MSYKVFRPVQGCGCGGRGCSGCGCQGFGLLALGAAMEFNAASVWSDWMTGQGCGLPGTLDQTVACGAAKRAVDTIRAALGALGYGGLGMGVSWGSADQAAYKKWAKDAGLQSTTGLPLKDQLVVMEEQLSRGLTPGPEKPVEYEMVGEDWVKKMGGTTTIAAVAAGVLLVGGGLYLLSRRKKATHVHVHSGEPATGASTS